MRVHRLGQRIRRDAAVAFAAALGCTACHRGAELAAAEPVLMDTTLVVPGVPTPLQLDTYEGSGQTVHPDFLTPIAPWKRRGRYLVATPYPFSRTKQENPTLYSGGDGLHWKVARGTPNPLVFPQNGYLSDPDIVYANARNELFLYYRQAEKEYDDLFLIRSTDGVSWGEPQPILSGAPSTLLSPAIVRRSATDWMMWSVNADSGCRGQSATVELRHSSDGISWGAGTPVTIDGRGGYPWHIDVQWIPSRGEYWALFPVKRPGGCATEQLFLATSRDGTTWVTLPTPVLRAGAIKEFADVVYRSTFRYDPKDETVTLWYSGARTDGVDFIWSIAVQQRARAELFATLSRASTAAPMGQRPFVDARFVPP